MRGAGRGLLLAAMAVAGCEAQSGALGGSGGAGGASGGAGGETGGAGGETGGSGGETGGAGGAAGGAGGGGARLDIDILGDVSPQTFTDGLQGQTPSRYIQGLGAFQILRSADDLAPVVVFDHGADWVPVDMLARTRGGSSPLARLPRATYTHGRVRLAFTRFTVDAVAHALGQSVPGELTITSAHAATTVVDAVGGGASYLRGESRFRFVGAGIEREGPIALPDFPATGGGSVVEREDGLWLEFPLTPPVVIEPTDPSNHLGVITYALFESFRWRDEAGVDWAEGSYDLDGTAMSSEPVLNFGATGYSIAWDPPAR